MVAKLEVDVDKFWRDGYLILRGLFSPAEFRTMRDQVFASLEGREKRGDPVVDALADPYLKHWVYDERLVVVAKAILQSERLAYFGDGGYALAGAQVRGGGRRGRLAPRQHRPVEHRCARLARALLADPFRSLPAG